MDGIEALVAGFALAGSASALYSLLSSFTWRRRKKGSPRVTVTIEQADGTHTTVVLNGMDDRETEHLIRDIEGHAVESVDEANSKLTNLNQN